MKIQCACDERRHWLDIMIHYQHDKHGFRLAGRAAFAGLYVLAGALWVAESAANAAQGA